MPVLSELREVVLWLTLSRPARRNALDHELVVAALAALDSARTRADAKVVVITGASNEAFSAGADLRLMASLDQEALHRFLVDCRRLFRAVAETPQPTIAALNGHAHGAGAEIACVCDLRIGCERTTFRFPGVSYGMAVGTWHLPLLVGLPKAKELLLTTAVVEAEEALRIGLLNRLVPGERLADEVQRLALEIAKHPDDAVRATKSLLDRAIGPPLVQRFYRELYSNMDRGSERELAQRAAASRQAASRTGAKPTDPGPGPGGTSTSRDERSR
jgi:enoyl-CoA hydratase/carnithine racemase